MRSGLIVAVAIVLGAHVAHAEDNGGFTQTETIELEGAIECSAGTYYDSSVGSCVLNWDQILGEVTLPDPGGAPKPPAPPSGDKCKDCDNQRAQCLADVTDRVKTCMATMEQMARNLCETNPPSSFWKAITRAGHTIAELNIGSVTIGTWKPEDWQVGCIHPLVWDGLVLKEGPADCHHPDVSPGYGHCLESWANTIPGVSSATGQSFTSTISVPHASAASQMSKTVTTVAPPTAGYKDLCAQFALDAAAECAKGMSTCKAAAKCK